MNHRVKSNFDLHFLARDWVKSKCSGRTLTAKWYYTYRMGRTLVRLGLI